MKATIAILLFVAGCGRAPGDPCLVSAEDFPCHRATATNDGLCSIDTLDDKQPCRTGIGVCTAGHCAIPPDLPSACQGASVTISDGVCHADAECLSTNPCSDYSCPSPGEDACLIRPKIDGTRCRAGFVCSHGECCIAKPDAACGSDAACAATEECTVGSCGASGVCAFARSKLGDSCLTTTGTNGRCVQRNAADVPRCVGVSG